MGEGTLQVEGASAATSTGWSRRRPPLASTSSRTATPLYSFPDLLCLDRSQAQRAGRRCGLRCDVAPRLGQKSQVPAPPDRESGRSPDTGADAGRDRGGGVGVHSRALFPAPLAASPSGLTRAPDPRP